MDYRKKNLGKNRKSLTDKPRSEYHLMEPVRAESRSFGGDVGDNSIDEGVDVHGPTTTVQGRCALATDTPTPVVTANLWCATTQPRGHSSCKQSKNQQEQVEQALNCEIRMKYFTRITNKVGFWKQADGRFSQHARSKPNSSS